MNAALRGLLLFLSAIALWAIAQETSALLGDEDGCVALEHRAQARDVGEDGDSEDTEESSESDGEEEVDGRGGPFPAARCPLSTNGRLTRPAVEREPTNPAHARGVFRPPRVDWSLRVEPKIRSLPVETRDVQTESPSIT